MKDKAIEMLGRLDRQFYWDMIDVLQTGAARVIEAEEDGVLIRIPGCTWYLMALTEERAVEFAERVAEEKSEFEFVTLHQDLCIEKLCRILGGMVYDDACHVATRFRKDRFKVSDDVDIRTLDSSHTEFVYHTYALIKDSNSGLEYAQRAIDRGMLGAFCDGECVGYIGTHEEGTMGMLEVLPDYRRRRLGSELEKRLCNTFMDNGRVPFCHIVDTNTASIQMHLQMGFTLSRAKIYWLANPNL